MSVIISCSRWDIIQFPKSNTSLITSRAPPPLDLCPELAGFYISGFCVFDFGIQHISWVLHSQYGRYYTACQGKRECPVYSQRRSSAGCISEMNCKSSGPLPGSVLAVDQEGCLHDSLSQESGCVFFLLTSGRSHLLSSLVLIGFCRRSRSSSSGTWKMFDDLISGFITWSRWGNDLKINSMRRDNSFCCPKFQARSKERILHKVVYIQIILRRVYIVWVECLFGVLIL